MASPISQKKITVILLSVSTMIVVGLAACSLVSPQVKATPAPTSTPTQIQQIAIPTQTQSQNILPQTDAEVPRVSPQDAKAAFDNGEAIIVDVRSPEAYKIKHIDGAISISLGEIEANPSGLQLKKDQWIITYCT